MYSRMWDVLKFAVRYRKQLTLPSTVCLCPTKIVYIAEEKNENPAPLMFQNKLSSLVVSCHVV